MVLFIGNVRRGEYETLRDRGLSIGLLHDELDRSRCARLADLDLVLPWRSDAPDDDTAELICQASRQLPLAGVLNVREFYVEVHARLGKRLGYVGVPPDATEWCLSKRAMLARLRGSLGAAWVAPHATAGSVEDVLRFGDEHGYPLIIKPSALHSSFFVTRIDRRAQVGPVFVEEAARFLDYAEDVGMPQQRRGLQVERFLPGTLHSVDCLVDHDGTVHLTPVVDVLTGHDIGRDEFYDFARLAPSGLPPDDQRAIARVAVRGVRALGLRGCAAHVETIHTPGGPRLVEIAARPGGNRCRLLRAAHGIDFMGPYLALNRHQPAGLAGGVDRWQERAGRPSAIVTPFPATVGTFRSTRGMERVTGLLSYLWHEVTVEPGTRIVSASHGQSAFIHIELSADSIDQIRRDVAGIAAMSDLVDLTAQPAEVTGVDLGVRSRMPG